MFHLVTHTETFLAQAHAFHIRSFHTRRRQRYALLTCQSFDLAQGKKLTCPGVYIDPSKKLVCFEPFNSLDVITSDFAGGYPVSNRLR